VTEKKPIGLRQRRREGNIEGFVDAALELLMDEGYDAVTVAGVAKRMGCAPGAMYRYFSSKDELMVAAQKKVIEEIDAELQAALQRIDAHIQSRASRAAGPRGSASPRSARLADGARSLDPAQSALLRLMAVPLVQEKIAVERPAYFALLSLSIPTPRVLVATEQAQPSMAALMSLSQIIARLLDEAAEAGGLEKGDAARRAVILWASHQGTLQLRKLDRFGLPALAAERLSLDTVEPLLAGWGAPPIAPLYDRARKILAE
jgi:AcrR family transcriptional regulator